SRCLQLMVKPRNRVQEKQMQELILHCAATLAPYVETTGPGISTVKFTDNRNLKEKVSVVIRQLADVEIVAQAGLAPTAEVSFLAAHFATPILEVNDTAD